MLTLLERVIDPAYHLAQMFRHSFGNDEPPTILKRLKHLYGQPSLVELNTALLHPNNPIDRNQPVEVMLLAIKEVHMFLLAHPEAGQKLSDMNLILYTLINLNKTGDMYTRALELWNVKELTDCKI